MPDNQKKYDNSASAPDTRPGPHTSSGTETMGGRDIGLGDGARHPGTTGPADGNILPVGTGGRLRINTVWAILGNLSYVGGRILIVVVLTKSFSSRQVGEVLFSLAVVTPLSFLINMELRTVFVTDTKNIHTLGDCITMRLLSNLLFIFVLGGICLLQRGKWDTELSAIMLMAGAVRIMENMADLFLGVFQKHEKMRFWAVSQILKTSLVFIWACTMALWTDRIVWLLVGWFFITLVVFVLYDQRQARRFEPARLRWHPATQRFLVHRGVTLGFYVTMAMLNHQVAQYFIAHDIGPSQVAYYGVLLLFVNGASAVQNGANQAILPRLAVYFHRDLRQFVHLLGKMLAVSWFMMLLGLALIWWQGASILRLLYSPEYAAHADLFTLVTLAGCIILTGMILGDAVIACHRFKSRLVAVGAGLAVNVILCWLLVGKYGLPAAAWSAVASSTVTATICALVLLWAVKYAKT